MGTIRFALTSPAKGRPSPLQLAACPLSFLVEMPAVLRRRRLGFHRAEAEPEPRIVANRSESPEEDSVGR